jgi:hypothetical protein
MLRLSAAKDAVALSDPATQPNVRIGRESRASPRPSRRRNEEWSYVARS